MAWHFSTEPGFQEQLDRMRALVRAAPRPPEAVTADD
jgi:hypothetical protein